VTGFRGRSGRSFRAHLALRQTEDGKWRVEFDELWAKEGVKPPDADEDTAIERARDGAAETGAASLGQRSAA
jgi:DNA topoisomerase-3